MRCVDCQKEARFGIQSEQFVTEDNPVAGSVFRCRPCYKRYDAARWKRLGHDD